MYVCVCVCLCEKVCQLISYEQVDRFERKCRCMLQLASNRKPPLASMIGAIFPHILGGGDFCHLNPYISETIPDI